MLPHSTPREGFNTKNFNRMAIVNLLCFSPKIFSRQSNCSCRMQHQLAIRHKIWTVNYFFAKHKFKLFTKLTNLWVTPWPLSKRKSGHQRKKRRRSMIVDMVSQYQGLFKDSHHLEWKFRGTSPPNSPLSTPMYLGSNLITRTFLTQSCKFCCIVCICILDFVCIVCSSL